MKIGSDEALCVDFDALKVSCRKRGQIWTDTVHLNVGRLNRLDACWVAEQQIDEGRVAVFLQCQLSQVVELGFEQGLEAFFSNIVAV